MIDLGAGADINAHGDDGALLDDDSLHDLGTGADEAVILDDGGRGLDRLQDAANADSAGQMHVFADLGAGADGGPGIDHGARIDIGADVDIGGHEDTAGGDIGAAPGRGRGHHPHPGLAEVTAVEVLKLGGDLVVIVGETALHEGVVLDAEGQQHRLLDPVVHHPDAIALLRHPDLAPVEAVDGVLDRVPDQGLDAPGGDLGTVLEGLFDGLAVIAHGHTPKGWDWRGARGFTGIRQSAGCARRPRRIRPGARPGPGGRGAGQDPGQPRGARDRCRAAG